jgi:hypothetical protein
VKEMQKLELTQWLWKRGLEPWPYQRFHEAHTQLYSICVSYLEMVKLYIDTPNVTLTRTILLLLLGVAT